MMRDNTKLESVPREGSGKNKEITANFDALFGEDEYSTHKEKSRQTKKSYWAKLAAPNPRLLRKDVEEPPKQKKHVCISNKFCPPRIDQLANPTTPRMEGILTDFHNTLEPERIVRLVKLIHTNKEPKPIRHTVKRKKKPTSKKTKKQTKEKIEKKWLDQQSDVSAQLIMDHLSTRVAYTPNYKQVILSLNLTKALKSKNHNNPFKEHLLKFCEQLAIIADREWEPYQHFEEVETESEEDLIPDEMKKHVYYRMESMPILSDDDDDDEERGSIESSDEDFIYPGEGVHFGKPTKHGPSTIYEDTEEEDGIEQPEAFGDVMIKEEPDDEEALIKQEAEDQIFKEGYESEAHMEQESEDGGADIKEEGEEEVDIKEEGEEEVDIKEEGEEEVDIKEEGEEEVDIKEDGEEEVDIKEEGEEVDIKQESEEDEIKQEGEDSEMEGAESKQEAQDDVEPLEEIKMGSEDEESMDENRGSVKDAVVAKEIAQISENEEADVKDETVTDKDEKETAIFEEDNIEILSAKKPKSEGEREVRTEGEAEDKEQEEAVKDEDETNDERVLGSNKFDIADPSQLKNEEEETLREWGKSIGRVSIHTAAGASVEAIITIDADGEDVINFIDAQGKRVTLAVKDLNITNGVIEIPEGLQVATPPTDQKIHKVSILDEHPEDTASYVSYRVYSSWLEEFGHNIQTYSTCLRTFREIFARAQEQKDINATQHAAAIREVLLNWSSYLAETMQFETAMKDYFKGKVVTRCHRCSNDYNMYNLPSNEEHPLPKELRQALEHTAHWKQLLANAERHCKLFTSVLESDSFGSSYITIEIQDVTSMLSGESAYIMEQIEDDD